MTLADSLAELKHLIDPLVRAKGLEYGVELCDATLRVLADREKLEQILLDLCTNATKFTDPPGSVHVHCDADDINRRRVVQRANRQPSTARRVDR